MTAGAVFLNVALLNVILDAPATTLWLFVHRVYYIPAHAMAAIWIGIGLTFLAERFGTRCAVACGLAGIAAAAIVNGPHAAYQADPGARNYVLDFLDSVPRDQGVLSIQDTTVFGIAYAQIVERRRRDVVLMSKHFGWDGTVPERAFTDVPLGPNSQWKKVHPNLAPLDTVPHGLAYLLVATTSKDRDPHAFSPLRAPPRKPPGKPPSHNPFAAFVRSRYAVYFTDLGAWHHRGGRPGDAQRAFDESEALEVEDAFAYYHRAVTYRDLGIRAASIPGLLRRAIELYDRHHDRQLHLTYPIARSDIVAALAELEKR